MDKRYSLLYLPEDKSVVILVLMLELIFSISVQLMCGTQLPCDTSFNSISCLKCSSAEVNFNDIVKLTAAAVAVHISCLLRAAGSAYALSCLVSQL